MVKKGKRADGEGTVCRRGEGWEAKLPYTDSTGKKKRKSFYGQSQEEVMQKRKEFIKKLNKGEYVNPDRITVSQWVNDWLDDFGSQDEKRPSTVAKYRSITRVHILPYFKDLRLQDVTITDIKKFYNQLKGKLSTATISVVHIILKNAFDLAIEENKIVKNPCRSKFTKPPKVKNKETKILTKEEVDKFLEAAKAHGYNTYVMFYTYLYTGLRRGELAALRRKNVDLKTREIKVLKTYNRVQVGNGKTELRFEDPKTEAGKRNIPLRNSAVAVLKEHFERLEKDKIKTNLIELPTAELSKNGPAFPNPEGNFQEPRNILKLFKKLLIKAGLPNVTVHSLRHYFLTDFVRKTQDLKAAMIVAGHADERMILKIYDHPNKENIREAMDKCENLS